MKKLGAMQESVGQEGGNELQSVGGESQGGPAAQEGGSQKEREGLTKNGNDRSAICAALFSKEGTLTPEEQFAEIRATLAETVRIQREQAKQLLTHAKLLAEHDERLERIGRHLEVLIDIVDGMIRKSK